MIIITFFYFTVGAASPTPTYMDPPMVDGEGEGEGRAVAREAGAGAGGGVVARSGSRSPLAKLRL